MNTKFKVGDIVYAKGFGKGRVIRINDAALEDFKLAVKFEDSHDTTCFTLDGRFISSHKEPMLALIERPKKYKKVWVNLYHCHSRLVACYGITYDCKDAADRCNQIDRKKIGCAEIELKVE